MSAGAGDEAKQRSGSYLSGGGDVDRVIKILNYVSSAVPRVTRGPETPPHRETLDNPLLISPLFAGRGGQYSYAGALHACLHLRDAEMSMGLLEKMEQDGMPANAMGYATAMRTCARCDKSFEAVLLYAQSLKLGIVPTKVDAHFDKGQATTLRSEPLYMRSTVRSDRSFRLCLQYLRALVGFRQTLGPSRSTFSSEVPESSSHAKSSQVELLCTDL